MPNRWRQHSRWEEFLRDRDLDSAYCYRNPSRSVFKLYWSNPHVARLQRDISGGRAEVSLGEYRRFANSVSNVTANVSFQIPAKVSAFRLSLHCKNMQA